MQAAIVPFHWMHAETMDLRWQERLYIEHMPDWNQRIRYQQANSLAYTYISDGTIIGSYGFIPMWTGVWEVWLLTAQQCEAHVLQYSRSAKTVIDAFMRAEGVRRLQAAVNLGDPRAVRFARFLQFEREGVLKAYGPDGSDYMMMARVT
jgi:hypothetical protein